MQIFVEIVGSRTMRAVTVDPEDSIDSLREKVAAMQEVPAPESEVYMIAQGRCLHEGNATLSSCDIRENTTVMVHRRLRGGGIAGYAAWLQRNYGQAFEPYGDPLQADGAFDADDKRRQNNNNNNNNKPRQDPVFDNLYLDMNGLIHPCCHDTAPKPEPQSEEEMFERIFKQLDDVIALAKPRKVLFLAVDGVAPRSKMNQQRARRFRAATERQENLEIAKEMAEAVRDLHNLPVPPMRPRWDHNVITPSTPFMERIGQMLEWYVLKRLNSDDPLWKELTVILSDAHVPGEGEHKLMHYIRTLRAAEDYDAHTHHCIFGMDADLICLGLVTHELNFTVLRNATSNDTKQPIPDKYCTFNLRIFRSLLKRDFNNLGQNYNFERVIDDFVFLCFFIGNDFLPHMPLVEIKQKGIETMLDHYVRHFDSGNYLTKGGEILFGRLRRFLEGFVEQRYGELLELRDDKARFTERSRQSIEQRIEAINRDMRSILKEAEVTDGEEKSKEDLERIGAQVFQCYVNTTKEQRRFCGGVYPLSFNYGAPNYREAYYASKFGWELPSDLDHDDVFHKEKIAADDVEAQQAAAAAAAAKPAKDKRTMQKALDSRVAFEKKVENCCREYLRGMQWVMRYYTVGCPSWTWYFPFHFAPLLEDVAKYCENIDVDMQLGRPVHPVHQLLAVMPQESYLALPPELHSAVLQKSTVLQPFYPEHIEVDFTEATFAYQGVIKLPFMDVDKLVTATSTIYKAIPDVGCELVFVRDGSAASKPLKEIVPVDTKKKEAGGDETAASTKMVKIGSSVTTVVPLAGRVGRYEYMWGLHETLECPDRGFSETCPDTEGSEIVDNKVIAFKYQMHMNAAYLPVMLVKNVDDRVDFSRNRSAGPRNDNNNGNGNHQQRQQQQPRHNNNNNGNHQQQRRDQNDNRPREQQPAVAAAATEQQHPGHNNNNNNNNNNRKAGRRHDRNE